MVALAKPGIGHARGTCCESFRHDLAEPAPPSVAMVSVYTRRDGVVDWRACIDEQADNVEVCTTDCGMLFDQPTCAEVADGAARFEAASTAEYQLAASPAPPLLLVIGHVE